MPEFIESWVNDTIEKLVEGESFKFCTISIDKKMDEIRVVLEHVATQTIVWVNFVSMEWKDFIFDIEENIATTPELKYLYLINMCMIRQRGMHYSIKSLLVWGICSFFMFERRRQRTRTLT